ncbi:MAG: recombinase family protein [Phycisphaerae bacterium]|nr:recombinase family protein [Planctomycetia bacterium]MCL4718718.1 recombinase family protein [Phycisphaerae bacterium]
MKVVIWARVSSREQREGYSIDAQLRACRTRAEREGWAVAREFAVAESAKRGAERLAFNEMYEWVRRNARKEGIGAVLAHKLDRVCRNMRDAVRMQELEDKVGVKLAFVDNQFGPGAAGTLSFNVMAAVSQYYSDNLRSEVIKGKDEKVRQGWLAGGAPYGYLNSPDRNEPIQPHPQEAQTVLRIFELYAQGNNTFELLAEKLLKEGHVYRPSQPKFYRTAMSYILNNRFYIGEIKWHGEWLPGRHKPLIERTVFERCQDILHGRNRRTGKPEIPLAGGLFTCAHCGSAITGGAHPPSTPRRWRARAPLLSLREQRPRRRSPARALASRGPRRGRPRRPHDAGPAVPRDRRLVPSRPAGHVRRQRGGTRPRAPDSSRPPARTDHHEGPASGGLPRRGRGCGDISDEIDGLCRPTRRRRAAAGALRGH